MRGLGLLIELARRQADERRASLALIGRAKADVDAACAAHDQREREEAAIAINDPAVLVTRDAWSRNDARTRATLHSRSAELARLESGARDALRAAFADMKRLEVARDAGLRQERTQAMRRADMLAAEAFAATGRLAS
ncbi:MAG: hypothetical protein JO001_10540 [Alphaproteobacteria bacterium]|nr:hypothetical protein [Alphaproteobacteria bacterium]